MAPPGLRPAAEMKWLRRWRSHRPALLLRADTRHLRPGNRPLEDYLASFRLFCVFISCH